VNRPDEISDRRELAAALRDRFYSSGLSYARLADQARLSTATVHSTINGTVFPRAFTLEALVRLFGEDPAPWLRARARILNDESRAAKSARPERPRPVVPVPDDLEGYETKPNPFDAASLEDLNQLLIKYWHWAGGPAALGSRKIADHAEGAFSHATVAKILKGGSAAPPLKLQYVVGLVRGCGGDADEQRRWASAWRKITQASLGA